MFDLMARLERFELPTARFVAEYSIQLSYRRFVQVLGASVWILVFYKGRDYRCL